MSARRPARPRLTRAKLTRALDAIEAVRACTDLGSQDRARLADAGLLVLAYRDRMDERTAAAAARIEARP